MTESIKDLRTLFEAVGGRDESAFQQAVFRMQAVAVGLSADAIEWIVDYVRVLEQHEREAVYRHCLRSARWIMDDEEQPSRRAKTH
jgi:hypothetical protein